MSANDQSSVVAAKKLLQTILIAIQHKKGDLSLYLTESMNRRYPTKQELFKSMVDDESSVLGLLATDFNCQNGCTSVELGFSAVTSSEGIITVSSKRATLTVVGGQWKMASVQ